jgi:hypothetical protein
LDITYFFFQAKGRAIGSRDERWPNDKIVFFLLLLHFILFKKKKAEKSALSGRPTG